MSVQTDREKIAENLSRYDNLVGFDLDGTLNDLSSYQNFYAQRYFGKEPFNPNAYDIKDMYACSHLTRQLFWARYIWRYCLKYSARTDAKEVLDRLRSLNLMPCMITARVYVTNEDMLGQLFRAMVYYWDKKEKLNIGQQNIIFCSEKYSAMEKSKYCRNLNVRWMFEDKPDNVMMISKTTTTHVLCLKSPYNSMIKSSERISVIGSLTEGMDIIEKDLNNGGYQYVK